MLIMDVYAAHRTDRVKNRALELGIEILYVPSGGTAQFQHLDARIFGELKSRAHAEFHRFTASQGFRGATYEESIKILRTCWEKISSDNVQQAWSTVGLEGDE
jgi:hypothetical protein